MTVPVQDPFADPIIPPSTHPTVGSFRGRLIMITVTKLETVPDNLNKGKMVERATVSISLMDGRGPVPIVKGNPPQPTGQFLEGPDFTGVWLQSERVVTQIRDYAGTGRPILGVIDTRNPGTAPGQGNPWGLTAATSEQKAQAVQFLAQRTVGGAAAAAPQPVYPMQAVPQPAPVYGAPQTTLPQQPGPLAPAAAPIPALVPQAAPPVPVPGSAPAGVNPFT